jgi:hypothetical protein
MGIAHILLILCLVANIYGTTDIFILMELTHVLSATKQIYQEM